MPVEKDSFPERMVALAEDITMLGEHWGGAEADLREILFESAEQIFRSRDHRVHKAVTAQFAPIQADSAGVHHHKLPSGGVPEEVDPANLSATSRS